MMPLALAGLKKKKKIQASSFLVLMVVCNEFIHPLVLARLLAL